GEKLLTGRPVKVIYSIFAVPPPNPELIINPDVVFFLTLSIYDNGFCDNSTSFNLLGFARLSLRLNTIVCVDKSLYLSLLIFSACLSYCSSIFLTSFLYYLSLLSFI